MMSFVDFALKDRGSMTIDEIKSELEMRGVDYSNCLTKKDLLDLLNENRMLGRANPDVLKKFNELREDDFDVTGVMDSELIKDISAKDGTLPGGLPPEVMKALASDRDIVQMLRDPKMQDIMSAVMTGGPQALQKV